MASVLWRQRDSHRFLESLKFGGNNVYRSDVYTEVCQSVCRINCFKGTLVPGNRHAIHEFTDQLWLAYESFITVPNTGPF